MDRRVSVLGVASIFAAGATECVPPADPGVDVAVAHAPVHYQDTDDTSAQSDWLTAIDYDGNWTGTDNWDHLFDPSSWAPGASGLGAVVYRSVVETCTHWFVVYGMFHPRDWTDSSFDQEHENDLEGALVIVEKDGSATGRVAGLISVAHLDFFSYVPDGSAWTDGSESIDGVLSFAPIDGAPHPMTSQEAKGHGLKAWPYAGDFAGNPGEDGVIYVPGTTRGTPGTGAEVPYQLVNLFDVVWPLQIGNFAPFAGWGVLAGDSSGDCGDGITVTCSDNAAHMPWGWDDHDDGGALQAGMLALDPAKLADQYFDGLGDFALSYVSNRYLEDLRTQGYTDATKPSGFPSALSLDEMYTRLGATCL